MNWIIIDKRLPGASKKALTVYGSVLEFESSGVVYDAISGHPDIFICDTGSGLIVAPNSPPSFINKLNEIKVPYKTGDKPLGRAYPETSRFNAVVTKKYLIHNLKYTDKSILDACDEKIQIHTRQAYTRCNLIALNDNAFITSDKSIEKSLLKQKLNVLFVSPEEIVLPGFQYGFFGGCCGVHQQKFFISGSLKHFKYGNSVLSFIKENGLETIELIDDNLFDCGGLFFINNQNPLSVTL